MPRTPDQDRAVKLRGTNILVSAAAGSGKTSVLVDRIISFVLEGVSLERMLVVTFTNAAAGEMRERLARGLQEALEASRDPEEKRYLRKELRDLPSAHVSTMHTFCGQELRRYHHFLDIEPNFRILTGASHAHLMDEALERTMEVAYDEGSAAFLELLTVYGGRFDDRALKQLVRALYTLSLSNPDPVAWLEALRNQEEAVPAALWQAFLVAAREILDDMDAVLGAMEDLLAEEPELAPYEQTIGQDAARHLALSEALDLPMEAALKALLEVGESAWARLVSLPKYLSEGAKETKALFQHLRNKGLKDLQLKLLQLCPKGGLEGMLADHALQAPRSAALVDLTLAFRETFRAAKAAKNGLDFADLEHEMIRLLAIDEVREELRSELALIFFDEYQDANPVQEAIVERLANPAGLFFVGDVKQAIYRFRQADPRIFNRRYARYLKGDGGTVIHLSENFRSREGILTFCNRLFAPLMTLRLGDVDYRAPGQALIPGRTDGASQEAQEVRWARLFYGEHKEERYLAEGLWIAEECKRLAAAGHRYSDMAILLRVTANRLAAYEEALASLGIPCFSDSRQIDWTHLEVRLFLDLLRVIDNDEKDVPLLAVLTSPFVGFSEAMLAQVRLAHPEERFAFALKAAALEEAPYSEAVAQFYAKLERHRFRLRLQGLSAFAQALFEESGYRAYLESLEAGHDRVENVQALIDLMRDFEADHVSGLFGFLAYVEGLERDGSAALQPALALGDEDNCVRLMSVHKSKGLGFPIVFLADLNHEMNFRDTSGPMISHMDLGVAFEIRHMEERWHRPSFAKRIVARAIQNDTRSEEVRLLYVAMTRAKERLYLVSSEKERPEEAAAMPLEVALHGASSHGEWLRLLWSAGLLGDSLAYEEVEAEGLLTDDGHSAPRPLASLPRDERLLALYREIDRFVYPYREESEAAYKQTVSELSAAQQISDAVAHPWPRDERILAKRVEPFPRPAFLEPELHFTAMEMGTLLHRAFELLPLEAYDASSLSAALDRLTARGLFRPEERAALDEGLLLAFFQSPLGARILAHRDTVEREVAFTMHYEGHLVDGQIDLLYVDQDGVHIVDFKSDRQMHPERYRLQLALYARAVTLARSQKVASVELYWLRHGESSVLELPEILDV